MGVSVGPQAWGCPWRSGTVLGTKLLISLQIFLSCFHSSPITDLCFLKKHLLLPSPPCLFLFSSTFSVHFILLIFLQQASPFIACWENLLSSLCETDPRLFALLRGQEPGSALAW